MDGLWCLQEAWAEGEETSPENCVAVLRATVRIESGVTDSRVGSLDRLPSLLTVMACGWAGGV